MSWSRARRALMACLLFVAAAACAGPAAPADDGEVTTAAAVDPGTWYTLVNRHSGKVLDDYELGTADGADVVQWAANGGAWQQWRFVPSGEGWYRILNRHSNKVLDVWGWSRADGADVVQWTDHDGANQQWRVVEAGDGHVSLLNRHSGKALEAYPWSTADGGDVVQWAHHGGANQQWELVPVGGDDDPDPPGPGTGEARQVEALDRGLISLRSGNGNLVSWRLLGTDDPAVAFHVYRDRTRLTSSPLTGATNYRDEGASAGATYTVRPVVGGVEQAPSRPSLNFTNGYLDVPLSVPGSGYSANDAGVGDLDGDGDYEIVLKWDPSNSRDNSRAGFTGNVYVDAYDLSGRRLWRIDLGRNIRAGAHYTQFIVYDLDGDGRAEVAMKTADGTRSGTGQVIGNAWADHRNADGYILEGPEFLTVFDGRTGAVLDTVDYVPGRGRVADWGDDYGNRVDRFLAGVAYLDGRRPSLVFARGVYTRTVIAAWDVRNGQLDHRWTFDTDDGGNGAYAGQGNHSLSIADVDGDGRDEVVYGAMAVDDDGSGLWSTGYGPGDALHVGDLDPDRPGLEVFDIQERVGNAGAHFDDARTGRTLWRKASGPGAGEGPGRGVSADVYAGSRGAESWVAGGGITPRLWDTTGRDVGRAPGSTNFVTWWDGDPVRELLDDTHIDKYGAFGDRRLLTGSGVASNNGTKATPSLSGDILGDWREEVVWRTSDSRALRIYSTPTTTSLRLPTLVHDTQYRVALAWQNVAYNQPPHPGFYLGDGMATPPWPRVYTP